MKAWLIVGAVWAVGCSGSLSRQASTERADARRADERRADETVVAEDHTANADAPDVTDHPSPNGGSFFSLASETRVIGNPAPSTRVERPRHVRFIDLNLKQASTANALQFLADSGGFNLVLQGNLEAPVTVSLHHVDPFGALEAIAVSEHLVVEVHRGIVTVGGH